MLDEKSVVDRHRCYMAAKFCIFVDDDHSKLPTLYWFCLIVCFDSLRPINNLSVIKGRVFLGWTSTYLGLMFLLKDTTQWRRWGSNPRPFGLHYTGYQNFKKSSFIANSISCTTTKLSISLTSCLSAMTTHVLNYCETYLREMVKIHFGLLKSQVWFLTKIKI